MATVWTLCGLHIDIYFDIYIDTYLTHSITVLYCTAHILSFSYTFGYFIYLIYFDIYFAGSFIRTLDNACGWGTAARYTPSACPTGQLSYDIGG